MFPSPCGDQLAEAVRTGADPKAVVPGQYFVVRGGSAPVPPPGTTFSGAVGPTVGEAAAAVPHGLVRVSTAGAIRPLGGVVEWAPEVSRHGTVNQQHVN